MTLLGSFSHGETSENLTIKRSLLCLLCPMGCSLGFLSQMDLYKIGYFKLTSI